METTRRTILSAGLLTGAALSTQLASSPEARAASHGAGSPALPRDPFTLGVASGDPWPDGFVIWTRLAVDPVADDGLGGMPSKGYSVAWEVARDDRFSAVERRGVERTGPESGHTVHVELQHLQPGREYHYRFRIGTWISPVGRALTAPARGSHVGELAMAFVSCSNFPAGYFTAYRHLANDRPDVILHLGDYQYEGGAASNALGRAHAGPETVTLANYRQRQAQYKSDPDLQAAHAVAPWIPVWDDHEVDNNYADLTPENPAESVGFAARRAAAYQAYYENMPLRRTSVPRGPDMQLFRRVPWGDLATFHMLDTRQFRDDQGCGDGYKDCPAATDPSRSLPGMQQERWLADGFRRSRARWDLLGQQVFFGRRDNDPGAAETVSMDSWDGYRPSRDRVVQSWQDAGVRNPVVLTGDVHAHWASEVLQDWQDPDSKILGSELITTSITSGGDGYDVPDGVHPWFPNNPNLKFWTNLRGYVRTRITPDSLSADYRCVSAVQTKDQPVFTRRSYVIEDRVRGLQQTADNPLSTAKTTRRAAPSDEQIVRDTVREETGS